MSTKKKKKRNKRWKAFLPGRIMVYILLLIIVAFVGMLVYTDMLPMTYIAIILLSCVIAALLDYILIIDIRKKIRFILGFILYLFMMLAYIIGAVYIYNTYTALDTITDVQTETTEVHVYVSADDSAQNIKDIQNYTFSILKTLDREKTDNAIKKIQEELGTELNIVEMEGLSDMANFMFEKEHAMIMNCAYTGVFVDIPGYETFESRIKSVGHESIEVEVQKIAHQYTYQPMESQIESDTEGQKETKTEPKKETKKEIKKEEKGTCFAVFISGIDTRGGMTASSLSDVNIIATVNTKTHQILLVSTPRDFFVPLSISNGIPDKLTHAGIYGVNVCEDTLGMLYDTEINYFFRLNFGGFVKIIDALGGIDVYSDYTFTTLNGSMNGVDYHFTEGWNRVTGEEALGFCRERYAFSEGDRQRGKNQMAVINGVIKKAQSVDFLKNYINVLNETADCFESNMPYEIISDMVKEQLDHNYRWDVFSYSANGTGATEKPYSMNQKAYVMIPDQSTVDHAKELMQKVKKNEILTAEDASFVSSIGKN